MSLGSGKTPLICTVLLILATGGNAEEVLISRQQRALAYPLNSCTGILVAISVPLKLPHRNVFMSYNFEANYNMPTTAPELIPGPLTRLDLVDKERSLKDGPSNRTNNKEIQKAPQLISRLKIYKLIENKINGLHLNGKKCLLRMICEAAHMNDSLFKHNGVLGDLLNILLTPSSTSPEGPPVRYHKAEIAGRKGDCQPYFKSCGVNLLDFFSSVL